MSNIYIFALIYTIVMGAAFWNPITLIMVENPRKILSWQFAGIAVMSGPFGWLIIIILGFALSCLWMNDKIQDWLEKEDKSCRG